ncbi:MAG: hypothetical protein J3Q66DRAFT_110907 [Benniella sp.]|nr:MAG: hypothetical protein J3Q66DRAFT_110907 [Benniella sp.]
MGRRLSMFCPCLPRRQRDNLSSRAFYPDQDSSGYSDNDDHDNDHDHSYSVQYPRPLSYFQQHHSRTEDHSSSTHPSHDNDNPWPSNFYNGRFSRQVNRSYEGGSGGRNSPRRSNNPFRTLSHDKDGSRETDTGITSFEPYRDDHEGYDDDDDEEEDEHQKLLKSPPSSSSRSKILSKMDFPPFRVKTAFSNVDDNGTHHSLQEVRAPIAVSLSTQPRAKPRSPRNPQGRMLWKDHDDNDDNHDGMADAEDILDVDALIAEQERITKELAKQEEALRKEEEAAIVAKRMAAIRAAERRGLLRFEGDQLVIPGSDSSTSSTSSNSDIAHEANKHAHQGQDTTRKRGTVQEDGNWNYSRRIQEMQHQGDEEGIIAHPMDGTTVSTSSAASSYVGGIDAFNQELKMMTLSVDAHRSKDSKQATLTSSQMTSTATTTTSPSQTRPRTVSTSAASTSNGASLPSPGTMISPRGVFSSVASFLKKVDGVIAGDCEDSSSDEAEPQRQQHRNNGPQGLVHQRMEGADNSVLSGTSGAGTGDHGAAKHSQETERKQSSTIATRSEGSVDAATTASFNKKPEIAPQASPSPAAAASAVTDAPATTIDPSASGGGVLGTFSSLLSTGASLIGYFGSGAVSQHYDSDEEYHGNSRRLSTIKYGDSKGQHFNPRRRSAVEDDDDDDGIDDYNF